jgi:hypothetical protein
LPALRFASRGSGDFIMPALSHGHSRNRTRTRTYRTWTTMRTRCLNKHNRNYRFYGAKGIKICPRWMKFENFLADMGPRPDGKTLDRWPNRNGNYEPSNCRWATVAEQRFNQSALVGFGTLQRPISWWATVLNVPERTLRNRMDVWPIKDVLTFGPYRRLRGAK